MDEFDFKKARSKGLFKRISKVMKTEIIYLRFQIFTKPADILFKTVLDKRG